MVMLVTRCYIWNDKRYETDGEDIWNLWYIKKYTEYLNCREMRRISRKRPTLK